MKRICTAVLSLTAVTFLLSGCGATQSSEITPPPPSESTEVSQDPSPDVSPEILLPSAQTHTSEDTGEPERPVPSVGEGSDSEETEGLLVSIPESLLLSDSASDSEKIDISDYSISDEKDSNGSLIFNLTEEQQQELLSEIRSNLEGELDDLCHDPYCPGFTSWELNESLSEITIISEDLRRSAKEIQSSDHLLRLARLYAIISGGDDSSVRLNIRNRNGVLLWSVSPSDRSRW